MKKKIIVFFTALFSLLSTFLIFGCSTQNKTSEGNLNGSGVVDVPTVNEEPEPPVQQPEEPTPPVQPPKPVKAEYLKINADSVNIRSGAGTGYSVLGVASKGTMYVYAGSNGNWLKVTYKNKVGYISADYCTFTYMDASGDKRVEMVIAEGGKCLGVPYVYGATRYLDENGKRIAGFSANKFDCSSLMQYVFKLGADKNLKLTTRTQIYQGTTVKASQIKRGDLLFFTNDSRKDNVGIERVGHVALYLGDNYILHTASDYAKIEQITSKRWSYFIQAQRIL